MTYKAPEVTIDLLEEDFRVFMMEQLKEIEIAFSRLGPPVLTEEPRQPREGMIVIADGTQWNPGAGAGYYGYRDGAWRPLE